MKTLSKHSLPKEKVPYLLRGGEESATCSADRSRQ